MTSSTTVPVQDRIRALEQATTFSESKRAMLSLVEGGEPQALESLLRRLLREKNENLLAIVGRAAISQWGETVISRIDLRSLSDTEKDNALYLCRLEGGETAQAVLCEALENPSVNVRHTAARLMGELSNGSPRILESLEKAAVSDDDLTVRRAAARSLAATNDPAAVPALERVLDQTGDEKVENMLIDLRLRVIERSHAEPISPTVEGGGTDQNGSPAPVVRPMGRVEYAIHQVVDRGRELAAGIWALLAASLRKPKGGDSLSPWRVATCVLALVLLVFAGLQYKETMERVRPHPERTAYVCPFCATYQEKILGPGARCERCGAYIFADRDVRDDSTPTSRRRRDRP